MKLFVYCAGGFGKEIMDVAIRSNISNYRWDEMCFIDDNASLSRDFYGTKILTLDQAISSYDINHIEVLIASGEPFIRKILFEKLKSKNVKLGSVIDTTCVISETAIMGEGLIATPYCSIASSAVVGKNVAINTKSIVGHDIVVGDQCVISSMVNIGGACVVGENSYIGMGTSIKEGVVIGKDVIIGMGSVVYNDVPDGVIALGNPARPMRPNVEKRVFK